MKLHYRGRHTVSRIHKTTGQFTKGERTCYATELGYDMVGIRNKAIPIKQRTSMLRKLFNKPSNIKTFNPHQLTLASQEERLLGSLYYYHEQ